MLENMFPTKFNAPNALVSNARSARTALRAGTFCNRWRRSQALPEGRAEKQTGKELNASFFIIQAPPWIGDKNRCQANRRIQLRLLFGVLLDPQAVGYHLPRLFDRDGNAQKEIFVFGSYRRVFYNNPARIIEFFDVRIVYHY